LDFVHFGSSLSVRGGAKIGDSVYFQGDLKFSDTTYLSSSSGSSVEAYVTGTRTMSLTTSGGTLHGTWTADTVVAVSDRRLKDNIKPLVSTLQKMVPSGDGAGGGQQKQGGVQPAGALGWVLRQLRPVSYNFKKGTDAKNIRFGFIADEMERVLPQVVREMPSNAHGPEKTKGIVYPDLVAVLTAMMRDFSSQMKAVKARVRHAEAELDRLDQEDPMDPSDGPTSQFL